MIIIIRLAAYFIPSEATSYLQNYAVLYHDKAFYVFGGYNYHSSYYKNIGRLDEETTTWTQAGTLVAGRYGHGAIFDGENFLIVGGKGTFKNEVCTLKDEKITCVAQSTTLENYNYYPELLLVEENYGTDLGHC